MEYRSIPKAPTSTSPGDIPKALGIKLARIVLSYYIAENLTKIIRKGICPKGREEGRGGVWTLTCELLNSHLLHIRSTFRRIPACIDIDRS